MLRRCVLACLGLAVVGALIVPCMAKAAGRAKGRPAKKANPNSNAPPVYNVLVNLQGTVQSVSLSQIVMLADASKKKGAPKGPWTILGQSQTSLVISGSATADYLHAGLGVQFNANVAGTEVQGKVGTLAIVGASKTLKTGVFAADPSTVKSKSHDAADVPLAESQSSKVVGRLGRQQGDKWPVHAGVKNLEITLDNPVTITVAATDARMISSGDRITVKGHMAKGKSGTCMADDIRVTMGHILTGKSIKLTGAADSVAKERAKLNSDHKDTEKASSDDADKKSDDADKKPADADKKPADATDEIPVK
jgi:hypothetical protein